MATKIITKNSSTATSIPTAGDLVQGELAVNVTDKRLFTEDSGGAIVELGTNPSTLTSGAATFSGSVGIGTSSPAVALDVNGATNTQLRLTASDSLGASIINFGDQANAAQGRIIYSHITDSFSFKTNNVNDRLVIDASGNVGIGRTSNIDYLLDVQKPADAYIRISSATTQENAGIILANQNGTKWIIEKDGSGHDLFVRSAAVTAMTISQAGNVGIGGNPIGDARLGLSKPAGGDVFVLTDTTSADLIVNCTGGVTRISPSTGILALGTGNVEKMRIDASGNLTFTNSTVFIPNTAPANANNTILNVTKTATAASLLVNAVSLQGYSTAATAIQVGSAGGTGRSINAGGTVNASGADYAEYERNGGLSIAKGDIVGFKADGILTLTFSEAIRFAVKSTDPSYVGGDTWGGEDQVGVQPQAPAEDAEQEVIDQYETDIVAFNAAHEAARQLVDRIAYSGKVPVNIQGATAGDYIIAVAADDGSIDGQAVSDPDFAQYKLSVGRVNRILEDGRAEVAVIIH